MDKILLSPSQVGTLFRCQYQWYLRYVEGLKIPPNPNMVVGSSFHKGYEVNFRQKTETFVDLDKSDIEDIAADEFENRAEEVEDWDKGKGEYKDISIKLADTYYPTAKIVQPVAVEDYIEHEIEDIIVRGYADIITQEMKVIDLKTSNKKPSGIDEMYKLQLETYALKGDLTGAELHYAIKTKQPKVEIIKTELPATDRTEKIYKAAADIIRTGVFAPTGLGHSWACSFCGYKDKGYCPFNR